MTKVLGIDGEQIEAERVGMSFFRRINQVTGETSAATYGPGDFDYVQLVTKGSVSAAFDIIMAWDKGLKPDYYTGKWAGGYVG